MTNKLTKEEFFEKIKKIKEKYKMVGVAKATPSIAQNKNVQKSEIKSLQELINRLK